MTEREYNECVNQHADHVYRFIVKNLRHAEDARDVVQSAFEKLWRNRGEVDTAKSKSYLFTVAYHEMIDQVRKHHSRSRTEALFPVKEVESLPDRSLKQLLNQALMTLSETQRSLVMLKDYEGYSYAEMGQITGLSETQVKVYLHRARLHLKNYLVSVENIL